MKKELDSVFQWNKAFLYIMLLFLRFGKCVVVYDGWWSK